MVLLPNPESLKKESPPARTENIFFQHNDLDELARHFIGNNIR